MAFLIGLIIGFILMTLFLKYREYLDYTCLIVFLLSVVLGALITYLLQG